MKNINYKFVIYECVYEFKRKGFGKNLGQTIDLSDFFDFPEMESGSNFEICFVCRSEPQPHNQAEHNCYLIGEKKIKSLLDAGYVLLKRKDNSYKKTQNIDYNYYKNMTNEEKFLDWCKRYNCKNSKTNWLRWESCLPPCEDYEHSVIGNKKYEDIFWSDKNKEKELKEHKRF